jgi:hypothetical protein
MVVERCEAHPLLIRFKHGGVESRRDRSATLRFAERVD